MDETDQTYPIVRWKRRRPRLLLAALALLGGAGVLPILNIAQASRHVPSPRQVAALDARQHDERYHVHVPGSITLGALIEAQKRARQEHAAVAQVAAEADTPAPPPVGEGWEAQLGAFSSAEGAERQRARLIEAGVPVMVRQEGALHRLRSLPAVKAETEGLCARAQASGVDCFVRRASTPI